ncbi:DUF4097 family beta strand repeat-containing protein [Mucilaginibacter sp.]|uniref:DUF4097 family beta strand repeat-containing protein n=1 Tax=Mucilaginibacter sp. TaxID=1882438 RepID=UPI002628CFC9|nr:DUF4097 family beta strand repeat-containing protein [Mucilaginibacter sp.]MDB4923550.1 hypothetical protein [Mucilaginibacter sp.]
MKIGCLTLIALLSCTRLMAQGDRQLVVHLTQPGKVFTLNVNIGRAAINVTGYDGKDVIVGVETDETKGRERADVTAQEKNNEVTVEAPDGKAVKLNIKVPQTSGIFKLSSVNGGTIMVSDITGNLELQNRSGGIVAEHISGSVVASTLSGRITVSFKSVDAGAAMAFSTLSGGINISFPASLRANLKIRSDHGKVFSDFELASDPAHPQTLKTERDGFYHLSIDDWIYGRVGGGGPEMLIKNTNGNIYIWKVK